MMKLSYFSLLMIFIVFESSHGDPDVKVTEMTQSDPKGGLHAQEDRLEKEDIVSAAERAAAEQTYLNRKADLETKMNQVSAETQKRLEERTQCQARVESFSSAMDTATIAMKASADDSTIRESRSIYTTDNGASHMNVVKNAKSALAEVRALLANHEDKEENQLAEIEEACDRLETMLNNKLTHTTQNTDAIKQALECPNCVTAAAELGRISTQINNDLSEAKNMCTVMAQGHKSLDMAAIEEGESLKKRLQQLEDTHRIQLTYYKKIQETHKQREQLVKALEENA